MKQQQVAPTANTNSCVPKEGLKVEWTYDLSIFKEMPGNRTVNLPHISRLRMSVRESGMLVNPILVNEHFQVIDGQHRLTAAKSEQSFVYYIVVPGYRLEQVHTLNLNQKNWTNLDYLAGYVALGLPDYITLDNFWKRHPYFNLIDCIALCSNITSGGVFRDGMADNGNSKRNEVFTKGTWKVRDLEKAERDALNIKSIEPFFSGYNRTSFIGTMLQLFKNPVFDFNDFMNKVRLQPTALVECANRTQYKALIEDIYNFKRREKVNLRY